MAFKSDYNRKHAITIPSAQVGSGGVTDFTVCLQRDHFDDEVVDPSGSNAAQSDGGDLVFTSDSAGNNRLALDIIVWEHDSSTGAGDAGIVLRVGPINLSSVSSNTIYVWYASSATESQPAAGDPFGQHAAYDSNWAGYWPAGGGTDRTSNGNDGTANGGVTAGGITGQVGDATAYDGSDDQFDLDASLLPNGTSARTTMGWHRTSSSDEEATISYGSTDGGDGGQAWRQTVNNGALQLRVYSGASSWGSGLADGAWHHTAITSAASSTVGDTVGYIDGDSEGSGSGSQAINTATTAAHLGSDVQVGGGSGEGLVDLDGWQAHTTARSAAWIETEYNATNDPASFASAGTPEDVGAAPLEATGDIFRSRVFHSPVFGGQQ